MTAVAGALTLEDGARIVYWSGFETEYGEVWAMDADGPHQRQLTETPDPHSSDNPTWSPDGGSVVFISGNMPGKTEIASLLIITKLEQYDYAGATAIAVVMLTVSFMLLLAINVLQAWTRRRSGAQA